MFIINEVTFTVTTRDELAAAYECAEQLNLRIAVRQRQGFFITRTSVTLAAPGLPTRAQGHFLTSLAKAAGLA